MQSAEANVAAATVAAAAAAPPSVGHVPSFREIHKNAWLKRVVAVGGSKIIPGGAKKTTNERWWIVFCVHGDIEPYLEGYPDTATATAHAPRWKVPLKNTLHVSGSVGPAKPHTEYEFVITLQEGIVRLIAPTWEAMQDWVDTLRNKLREMKIVSPKENVYSKGPEQSKPRAPTRDPTSPLPPPPPGPTIRVPGTDPSPRVVVGCSQEESCVAAAGASQVVEYDATQNAEEASNVSAEESSVENRHSSIENMATNLNDDEDFFRAFDGGARGSDDAFLDDALSVDQITNNVKSTSKGPEFLSNIASVSGMNICLGDSVLEEMMKNGDNKSLFTNFDLSDSGSAVQEGVQNKSEKSVPNKTVVVNSDVKLITDKYSQVDITKKTTKKDKGLKTSVELSDVPSTSTQIPRIKPQVLPRKIILTENKDNAEKVAQEGQLNSLKNNPVKLESNEVQQKLSETQDLVAPSKSNALAFNCNEDISSNVTIITVANNTTVNLPSPSSDDRTKKNAKLETVEYANFDYTVFDKKETENKLQNNLNNNDIQSASDGYGHIRHTTTVGVSSNEVAYENTKSSVIISHGKDHLDDESHIKQKSDAERQISAVKINSKSNASGGISVPHGDGSSAICNSTPKPVTRIDITKGNTKDEFYESVFTPFPLAKSSLPTEASSSKVVPPVTTEGSSKIISIGSDSNSNKSSIFYVEHTNPAASTKKSEYEFLFWNESNNSEEAKRTQPNAQLREDEHNSVQEPNVHVTSIQNTGPENDHHNIAKPATNLKQQRHGLFTRGLTEFSLISKFKHGESHNSPKSPLLQNSQFYSYEDMDNLQGTSSDDHSKKNNAFSSKINNIFHIGEDKSNAAKTKPAKLSSPSERLRTESSLRRNWSERNDRIVLPVVKNNAVLHLQNTERAANENAAKNATTTNHRPIDEQQSGGSRRRSNSLGERSASSAPPHPQENRRKPATGVSENGVAPVILRPMSLREQQVARLRGEMAHAGGVRLRLRTGDSPGDAMAMGDVYGTVWICGWKQRTHPLLYNALHIGDRLATVGGVPITSVRQAKKALKETPFGQHHVELVIKRLPHGRVYVIQREFDNQDLGLVLDGANIAGVIPNSLSARAGVPTGGTLTEINGRPLNLLLKKGDTQVKDRLNALGKDLSLLVQPTEFVALLKSSLRNMRGHKDYIVQ